MIRVYAVLLTISFHTASLPPADLQQGIVTDPDLMPMVFVPAGEFLMGSSEGDEDELPVHVVYTQAFYMDEHEVTNAQYSRFLNSVGRNQSVLEQEVYIDLNDPDCLIRHVNGAYQARDEYADHPVVEVTWYGARDYAEWAGKRLPTEAEWEKAARGGLTGQRFPWGDEITGEQANYDSDGERKWTTDAMLNYLRPIRSYAPNGYGLYDMAGNVWEWCQDWHNRNGYMAVSYSVQSRRGPLNANPSGVRVTRGGSWFLQDRTLRCANRSGNPPDFSDFAIGFRCVRSALP